MLHLSQYWIFLLHIVSSVKLLTTSILIPILGKSYTIGWLIQVQGVGVEALPAKLVNGCQVDKLESKNPDYFGPMLYTRKQKIPRWSREDTVGSSHGRQI